MSELDEETTRYDFLISTLLERHSVQEERIADLEEQLAEMRADMQVLQLRAERVEIKKKKSRSTEEKKKKQNIQ